MTRRTKKFSQFNGPSPIQNDDIVVGLRDGDNWQFTGVGSGGGGGNGMSLEVQIEQANHMLLPGNYVRINAVSQYVKAIALTAPEAEIVGVVKEVQDANNFTLLQMGYVQAGVFTGLIPGRCYFLSDTVPGLMELDEPVINGYVSLPVFIAETDETGYVRPFRGIINGGQPPIQTGGGGGTDNTTHTVNLPGTTLAPGDWVYLNGDQDYQRGIATSLGTSQLVGVVTIVTPGDDVTIQQSGYNIGAVTVDELGNPILPGVIYYLSTTVPGRLRATIPTGSGEISRPCYVQEHNATSEGWIFDQRPLEGFGGIVDLNEGGTGAALVDPGTDAIFFWDDSADTTDWLLPGTGLEIVGNQLNATNTSTSQNINQPGHAGFVGAWMYFDGALWQLGLATNETLAEVVGMVTAINVGGDPNVFTLQSAGPVEGLTGYAVPLNTSQTFFLSDTVAGRMTQTEPTLATHVSKPIFIATGTDKGWILNWRGEILSAGGGGGGPTAGSIIGSTLYKNTDFIVLPGTGSFLWADTGLEITITPSFSTSRILLIATIASHSAVVGAMSPFRFLRSPSTVIDVGVGGTYVNAGVFPMNYFDNFPLTVPMQASDSPATTSPVTYKIQYATNNPSVGFAINGNNAGGPSRRCISEITAFEIAG